MRLSFAGVAATALALTMTLGLPATGAQAKPVVPAPSNYLAVGDSVTQGLGVTVNRSYPMVLDAKAKRIKLAGNLAASGATVADVASQLTTFATADPAAAASITKISLTVGANDVGWVKVALACMQAPMGVACADLKIDPATGLPNPAAPTIQDQVTGARAALKTNLSTLLDSVATMYPKAKIYVGSYYELFGAKKRTCTVAPGYSISLVNKTWFNRTTRGLNTTIREAVAMAKATPVGNKVEFVDVARVFNGHGFCDSARRWVIGPQDITVGGNLAAIAHPNVRGQWAYAQRFFARGLR
jgi:lysophospholipase L1-like esterase